MRMATYLEERNKYWTIYPEHIDYRMSRRLGRKIPLDFAVENPTLEELVEACRSLKIPCIVEGDKRHPANWLEGKGRIRVVKLKKFSKRKLLKLLAYRIKQARQAKKEKIALKRKARMGRVLDRVKKRR